MRLCLSVGARATCGAQVWVSVCAAAGRLSYRRALLLTALLSMLTMSAAAATLPSGFTETQITGLSAPTAMAFAPDGRLFVCQQGGSLRVIKNGALLATPFVTLTVSSAGERGLLGIAFDPNFATNNFLYVYYTATTPAIHNRVSRFTANGDVVVAGSELVIIDLNNLSSATNHNGGSIHFGLDGKLYIAVGENANSANSQTFANLLGKMLRINPDPANLIPSDNPYFNDANVTGVNKAIWALGLRNPYTFAFQPGTGRMLINDVGQNTYEEIDEGVAHSNYGWPTCEGLVCGGTAPADYRAPIYVYAHSTGTPTGCAITGGAFYNPPTVQFPNTYVGQFFFADFCGNFIRYIDPNTAPPIPASTSFATNVSGPVDLQVASDGSLWYLARNTGSVGRVQYPAGQVPPTISQHPQSQSVVVGQTATFTVAATGATPFSYQWQRNTVDIAGANAASYTTPPVTLADNGAQYRCIVTNAFGNATSNSATLTVTQNAPPTGDVLISEFRNYGPDPQGPDPSLIGAKDDFVELYNNTSADITVATTDGSAGWALVSADATTLFVVPNGTVIPARAHYLAVNPAEYSLNAYATGNINFSADLTQGIALFKTATPANFNVATRLDAVGFSNDTGFLASLAHEGTPLPAYTTAAVAGEQFSYVRRLHTGTSQDTGDNASDFVRVCTCITQAGQPQGILGAPGPENLASPIQRNAQLKASLIEPQQPSTAAPNRVRDTTANVCNGGTAPSNCTLGTLDIRRRFKNSTGQAVTALRFRVVDITTLNTPNPGGAQADLRLLTSGDLPLTTSLGNLTVKGTVIEQPPTQPSGGGLNTSAVVNLGGQLAPGASINIHLLLGVQTGGSFRFLVNVEAVTAASALGKGTLLRAPRAVTSGLCPTCKAAGKL